MGEPSECIRARVRAARNIQLKRFSQNGSADIICNADMRIGEIRQFCKLPDDAQSLMRAAMSQLNLSARAYHYNDVSRYYDVLNITTTCRDDR